MDKQFFIEEVPEILENLSPEDKPEWGILTPQHMVEHLVGSWRISNGNAKAKAITPEEKLETYRNFLYSKEPFKRNIKNPVMGEGLMPLRKPDLQSAKEQLYDEVRTFFDHFENSPGATPVHPVFGPLDKEGWLIFQKKHMMHHFRQFNLID